MLTIRNRKWHNRILSGLAAAMILSVSASLADADGYGTQYYYRNPRTGRVYSQTVVVGNGYAYGGFTSSQGNRVTAAGSGYQGRSYYGNQFYSNRNYQYGQSWYTR
ncbi:MAG: hypothetical protein SGI77_18535 [Pirellulaceae bacterium]|nr:hypothetical protein [Pirellulaceae bacterium]